MGVVSDEAEPDASSQPVTQVIRASTRGRHVLEGVGDVPQLAQSDEMERVLSSATACLLLGHENVNLRILTVADVIHEVDLGPHEIKIAKVAVEKDAESNRRRNGVLGKRGGIDRRLLRVRRRKRGPGSDQERERNGSKAHHGPRSANFRRDLNRPTFASGPSRRKQESPNSAQSS